MCFIYLHTYILYVLIIIAEYICLKMFIVLAVLFKLLTYRVWLFVRKNDNICSLRFFTEPRMTDATARLSFYYSSYRSVPGVACRWRPLTSRDNYVRDTPFSETCDRDCKMSYVRSLLNAVICSAVIDKMCVVSPLRQSLWAIYWSDHR